MKSTTKSDKNRPQMVAPCPDSHCRSKKHYHVEKKPALTGAERRIAQSVKLCKEVSIDKLDRVPCQLGIEQCMLLGRVHFHPNFKEGGGSKGDKMHEELDTTFYKIDPQWNGLPSEESDWSNESKVDIVYQKPQELPAVSSRKLLPSAGKKESSKPTGKVSKDNKITAGRDSPKSVQKVVVTQPRVTEGVNQFFAEPSGFYLFPEDVPNVLKKPDEPQQPPPEQPNPPIPPRGNDGGANGAPVVVPPINPLPNGDGAVVPPQPPPPNNGGPVINQVNPAPPANNGGGPPVNPVNPAPPANLGGAPPPPPGGGGGGGGPGDGGGPPPPPPPLCDPVRDIFEAVTIYVNVTDVNDRRRHLYDIAKDFIVGAFSTEIAAVHDWVNNVGALNWGGPTSFLQLVSKSTIRGLYLTQLMGLDVRFNQNAVFSSNLFNKAYNMHFEREIFVNLRNQLLRSIGSKRVVGLKKTINYTIQSVLREEVLNLNRDYFLLQHIHRTYNTIMNVTNILLFLDLYQSMSCPNSKITGGSGYPLGLQ
jgi:hypothetical protein